MSIAGAAYGASKALEEILAEQMFKAKLQQQQQMEQARLQLDQQRMRGVEEDRSLLRELQARDRDLAAQKYQDAQAQAATDRNIGLDAANVLSMPGMDNAAKATELQQSILRNPNAASAPGMAKIVEGLTRVTDKKYTSPQRLADGTVAQFEDGQIPPGTKFWQEPKSGGEDATDLSPAGLDMAALNYRKTGMMPALGMGDKTTRKRIIDRAAALSREDIARIESGGMDIATNKGIWRADTGSLTGLQKQRDALGAFEQTALKNLDVFLATAAKVPDAGSPWVNLPLRALAKSGPGSPEMVAYETARRTVIPEFAKLLANPGLSGQLTDSARHEIDEVISGNATFQQTVAAARVLKQDTANRREAYDTGIREIRSRMSTGDAVVGEDDAAAKAARIAALKKKYGGG